MSSSASDPGGQTLERVPILDIDLERVAGLRPLDGDRPVDLVDAIDRAC